MSANQEGEPQWRYRFTCPMCGSDTYVVAVTMQLVSAVIITAVHKNGQMEAAGVRRVNRQVRHTAFVCGSCWNVIAEDLHDLEPLIQPIE